VELLQCGGFAQTCTGIQVNAQRVVTAACSNGNGGSVSASIDLNSFIVNNNGNLVDGAGFVPSCSNIWWFELSTSNQGVAAECRKADGTVGDTTTFIVEARVSNNGGILVFNSCRRRSLLEAVDASAIVGRKMLRV
jgi:hypothetical protein